MIRDQPELPTDHYGFSLRNVCWGYRDVFRNVIHELQREGLLGPKRQAVTREFFQWLAHADQSCFDHVLKEFLCALTPETRWILDLPGVFSEVVTLGRELAEEKTHYGVTYFRVLGEDGFGSSPREVRTLVSRMLRLRAVNVELAMAFLRGNRHLHERLREDEVDRFLSMVVAHHQGHGEQALATIQGDSPTAESIIRGITRECRLEDLHDELTALLRALVGEEVELSDLRQLDSDDLIECGSSVVCLHHWLYLPSAIRAFATFAENRKEYLRMVVMAAALLHRGSFCRLHGQRSYPTCRELVGNDTARINLFQLVEFVRVIDWMRQHWPGCRRLLERGLVSLFEHQAPRTPAEWIFQRLVCEAPEAEKETWQVVVHSVRRAAAASDHALQTAQWLDGPEGKALLETRPELGEAPLPAYRFLPDFLFPGRVSAPPQNQGVADRHKRARKQPEGAAHGESLPAAFTRDEKAAGEGEPIQDEQKSTVMEACYLYDEWCQEEEAYRKHHCHVHEKTPWRTQPAALPIAIQQDAHRVRRLFERLRPELARKEKRLPDGDDMDVDRLLDYLVRRVREPAPRIDFYEKPLLNRRDLTVLLLLDVSGSTGGMEAREKVIDIEKRTALIFATGLQALGDRFAVCGFSGSGRENCEFHLYKTFDAHWGPETIGAVNAATPRSSTRMGPALRHAGYLLSQREERQRLLLLITDGKPMDSGYDPSTRYAHFDVRRACEENARLGVQTFAVSTEENTRADMEIMFPRRRFVILPGIGRLPTVLPQLYLKLTT